jgi:hypothetical protein
MRKIGKVLNLGLHQAKHNPNRHIWNILEAQDGNKKYMSDAVNV